MSVRNSMPSLFLDSLMANSIARLVEVYFFFSKSTYSFKLLGVQISKSWYLFKSLFLQN